MKTVCLALALLLLSGAGQVFAQTLLEQKTKTIEINKQPFLQVDGYIEVPENWEKKEGKRLKLPVRIIKSMQKAPLEPVFYLDGGPGYSNLGGTNNIGLLKNHDFVFVGYRGADGSAVLTNKKLGKAFLGKNHQLLSDESLDHMVTTMTAYFADLEQQGTDISQYTILQVIEDLEYARKQLGYHKINLQSFSYGTRVALLYTYRYPEVIHRSVMAGANPPGHFLWYPEKTEEILNLWEAKYLASGKGSLKAAMKTAFDNMPKRWAFYRLDADKIKSITFTSMSQNELAVMVFDSYFRAAKKGDYGGLYMLQFLYDKFMKKIIWGEMYAKGASADRQVEINYRQHLRASDSTTVLGPSMSLLLWGTIEAWNNPLIPEEFRKVQHSQTETLIVSGNLDTSTPADFAEQELMPHLPKGQHVVLQNMSHADIANAQATNFQQLINTFFDTGVADASHFKPQEVDLKPKRRFHRLAKLTFPVLVVMNLLD
jgi:pimeloyl-ACP methyl ester carboxylesterase